jgi:predicted chitinase
MKIRDLLELSKTSPLGRALDQFSGSIDTEKIGNQISNVFKPDTVADTNRSTNNTSAPTSSNKPTPKTGNVLSDVEAELDRQGITDPFVRKAILAKTGQEAGSSYRATEIPYKNTDNATIRLRLPQLQGMSDAEINELKKDKEAFFNRAYGYEGNTLGNTAPGEGWKYRGRGLTGITGRYNEHRGKYSECLLLDVFAVNRSKDFESYIHNHKLIRSNRIRDLEGHENELELFLIGKELSYQMILDAINSQIDNFQESSTYKLELELEKLKLQMQQKESSTSTTRNGKWTIQLLIRALRMRHHNIIPKPTCAT